MRLYFSGIGGAGLGPLAQLCLDAGYEVTGSDAVDGLFTDRLIEQGVEVIIAPEPNTIAKSYEKKPFDWLVITSALPANHPDILFAATHDIRISKRDEVINEIITAKNLKLISIAGTHGKTTSTAMMVWAFKQVGIPVSYSIGSNISFGPAAKYAEGSEYFVYEADEFDRNFLHYNSFASIITSLDYDHPDTYPTPEEYYQAFADFVANTQDSVVLWSENHDQLKDSLPMQSYVRNPKPFVADASRQDPHTQAILNELKILGLHNRENAFLVLTMLFSLIEADIEDIVTALNSFPGTQRRFERLKPQLISDYAHHPDEIRATIQMAREYQDRDFSDGKVIVVYQPHQNIRQHEKSVQEGYKVCFEDADKVYWLPTYLSRENDLEVLSPKYLSGLVKNTQVEVAALDEALLAKINNHIEHGDVVICMGAGSIDGWLRNII